MRERSVILRRLFCSVSLFFLGKEQVSSRENFSQFKIPEGSNPILFNSPLRCKGSSLSPHVCHVDFFFCLSFLTRTGFKQRISQEFKTEGFKSNWIGLPLSVFLSFFLLSFFLLSPFSIWRISQEFKIAEGFKSISSRPEVRKKRISHITVRYPW